MTKAIIFDLDGIIIDSEPIAYGIWQDIAAQYGKTIPLDIYTSEFLGRTVANAAEVMKKNFNLTDDAEEILKTHRAYEKEKQKQGIPLKPGAAELLRHLKSNGYGIALASSSVRERAEEILSAHDILRYFDDLVFGYEVPRGKPFPDIFLKACEKLRVEPNEAVVIEDSEAGIEAAFSANIPVICVIDMKSPDEFHKKMTLEIFDSLYDIKEFLEFSNSGRR